MRSSTSLLPLLYAGVQGAMPGERASFKVGYPQDIVRGLTLLPDNAYRHQRSQEGWSIWRIQGTGYQEEDAWGFRLEDGSVKSMEAVTLVVEYVDEGYGYIDARRLSDGRFRGRYELAAASASHTRLNTGAVRRAAFRFNQGLRGDAPYEGGLADFLLTGIQHLKAAWVLEGPCEGLFSDLKSAIPRIAEPMAALRRPMDIVCSAGADVLGDADTQREAMLRHSLDCLREQLPLARALGFNGIEAYIRWNMAEREPGVFDWSFYDTIIELITDHGMKLFPLLIVGSAYALPTWFHQSGESHGFVCLEHGLSNPVQSIWHPAHKPHVTRFLQAFGSHYEPMNCLLGVRLGPSGCYGESQYPAQGDWGFRGEYMHLHIGIWAGDPCALADFQRWLHARYGHVDALNEVWQEEHKAFDEVKLLLPEQCLSKRRRLDTYHWYTDSMSDWCEWWALEARKAMPNTPIYQSAGGWGAAEIGTDYTAQTKSMLKIDGGIRLTNELDSFHQCYYATRLATTAARHYGVPLGFEPAMGHTARGTAGRLFNCITNNGSHFFTYGGNIFNHQRSIDSWLRHYALLDERGDPLVEIGLYYPQTMNFLSRDTFRYLNAWGFNPIAREIRDRVEVDYLDDRLIRDGALARYKALVFVWGNQTEQDILEAVDAWVRSGGVVIFPCHLYTRLANVEGDTTIFDQWSFGDVGDGQFHRYIGDDEPPSLYADFVREKLLTIDHLDPLVKIGLEASRPTGVFLSAQRGGRMLALNFNDAPAVIEHLAIGRVDIAPYAIELVEPTIPADQMAS